MSTSKEKVTGRYQSVSPAGFTLIELLVVIAILGLIAGLVGPQVLKQFASAKSETAKLQIADLGAGLDLFFLDIGRYPTTDEGLEALQTAPAQELERPLPQEGCTARPMGTAVSICVSRRSRPI